MKESEIYKGMKVYIKTSFHTRETHTVNNIMEHCIGGEYIIEDVKNATNYGRAAVIKDFWWNPKDLVSLEKPLAAKEVEVKVVNFDVKELVL